MLQPESPQFTEPDKTVSKPQQNRTAGAAKPTKPAISKENYQTLQFLLLVSTGSVDFATLAVRFCYGFVTVLSGFVNRASLQAAAYRRASRSF